VRGTRDLGWGVVAVGRVDPAGLFDRDRELAAVGALLDDAASGVSGLLLVEGEAGIGKTGIVRAAGALARASGLRVLGARGSELESGLAFGLVREMFSEPIRAADKDELGALFAGAAALARPVLEPTVEQVLDECNDSFATLHGLYWFVAGLCNGAPTLLAVDDAQWSDLPSLRFLAYLARRLDGLKVALLVTARPELAEQQELLGLLTSEPQAVQVRPRPLGRAAVHAMVSAQLGPAEDRFVDGCQAVTGGNPFLLTELLADLRDAAIQPLTSNLSRVQAAAPGNVRRGILARLRRLPAGAAALARAAAVLGDGVDPRRAARLADVSADQVDLLVDALAAARIIEPRTSLTFVHPLVRSAVVSDLGPAEIATAHREAVALLMAEGECGDTLVPHLLSSPPRGEGRVVELLRSAGQRAAARGAPDVSARCLQRALLEPPPLEDRYGVLLELGTAEMHAGSSDALNHLAAAAIEAPGPVEQSQANQMLARTMFWAGRIVDSVKLSERAIGELGDSDPELRLELEAELIIVAIQDVRTRPLVASWIPDRGAAPEPTSRAACMLLANMALEEVFTAGSREWAVAFAERALLDGRLYDEHPVACLPCAVLSLTLSGNADRSLRVWDDAMARQRARGDVIGFALASAFRGYAALHIGDLDAAVADTMAALELARGMPLLQMTAGYATAWLGYALVDAGDYGAAEKVLAAQAGNLGADAPFNATFLLSARGRLRLAQGRFAEAAADLRECGSRCAAWGATGPAVVPWRAHLALALLSGGDRDAAASVAADAVALARAWGVPSLLAEALRVAGLVTGGLSGLTLLREAVATADAGESRLERAHARTALGGALRRAGGRSEARQPLREAVDIALATGARAVARTAHEELVATGAKPRRLRQSGAEALTATERRVAGMAAEGLSNRGIAQALFVSEKTIETHLGSVYRKLGINTRTHLTEALARNSHVGTDHSRDHMDGSIGRLSIDPEQSRSERYR
jgi:DNA-binding CsgD family transcriptional regulator